MAMSRFSFNITSLDSYSPFNCSRTMGKVALIVSLVTPFAVAIFPPAAFAQRWESSNSSEREAEIIRRYQSILEKNPTRGFAFKQILSRVGTGSGLNKLIQSYQKKTAEHPDNPVFFIILGHFLAAGQRVVDAAKAYEAALKLEPTNSDALMGYGEVLLAEGKTKEASQTFQILLENVKGSSAKEDILRKLADIAFNNRDWGEAEKYYDQLVDMRPKDSFLRAEYADVLRKYGQFDKAIFQYQAIAKLNLANSKRLAETYRDIGDVYLQMKKYEDAIYNYQKGMKLVKPSVWLYQELQQRLIDVYRQQNKLPELVAQLKKSFGTLDYDEAMIMGHLYEEIGDDLNATSSYLRARKLKPTATDPRKQLISILERSGKDDEIIKEYKGLIAVSKNQSKYYFDLAKLHMRAGRIKEASAIYNTIERVFAKDPNVLAQLGDVYVEYDLADKALRIFQKLLKSDPKNDSYILSLGEQYYRMGEGEEALNTWLKLLHSQLDETEANVRLGQVLADHGLVDDALKYFRAALDKSPTDLTVRRGIALAYERAGEPQEALKSWEWVYDHAKEPELGKEARRQMVRIHAKYGTLQQKLEESLQAFQANPKDFKSALFASEASDYLGNTDAAEQILKKIIAETANSSSQDVANVRSDSLLTLEKLYERDGQLQEAIQLLKLLAKETPIKKRSYYDRIAELSLQRFDTNDAVKFAKLAIEMNPDDAQARAHLADIYMNMNELELAAKEYEEAFKIDPQAWDLLYKLADIRMQLNDVATAKINYQQIIQFSRDDTLVENAARKLINIADAQNNLASIEQQIFQLAFRKTKNERLILLVLDFYQWLTSPLISNERLANLAKDYHSSNQARSELDSIGRRISPILIDAADSKSLPLQYRAIQLASDLHATAILNSLARIIAGDSSPLRYEAVKALVKMGDPRAVPILKKMTASDDSNDVSVAFWALGCFKNKDVNDLLKLNVLKPRKNMTDGNLAMALFSLGRSKEGRNFLTTLNLNRLSDLQQLAALWGLSQLNQPNHEEQQGLIGNSDVLNDLIAISLAVSQKPEAISVLVSSFYNDDSFKNSSSVGLSFAQEPNLEDSFDFDDEAPRVLNSYPLDINSFLEYVARKRAASFIGIKNDYASFINNPLIYKAFVQGASNGVGRSSLVEKLLRADFSLQFGPVVAPISDKKARQLAIDMILAAKEDGIDNLLVDVLLKKIAPKQLDELLHSASPAEKVQAIRAVLFLPNEEAWPILFSAIDDEARVVRATALDAIRLRLLEDPSYNADEQKGWRERLQGKMPLLLRDPSELVQLEALRILPKLQAPDLLALVRQYLDNPLLDATATRVAIDSLSEFGTEEAKKEALKFKNNADSYVRLKVEKMIAAAP